MLCREVNHGGLAQLYEILLESATAQIVAALRLVLNAAEAGPQCPVILQGKRSGCNEGGARMEKPPIHDTARTHAW